MKVNQIDPRHPFGASTSGNPDDDNQKVQHSVANKDIISRPRVSRVISLVLGMSVLVLVGLGTFYYMDRQGIMSLQNDISSVENLGTVSNAELEVHNVPDDCWLVIHGNAYDLTEYAPRHPGGKEFITDFCGTDATSNYDREHDVSLLKTIDFLLLGTYTEGGSGVATTSTESQGREPTNSGSGTSTYESPESSEDEDPEEEYESRTIPAPTTTESVQTAQAGTTSTCKQQFYTTADIAIHADQTDCWYLLYGVVYDMTNYIDQHPGGVRRIFQECGTNATAVYSEEKKHDESLLLKEGMVQYVIGKIGSETGLLEIPC